MNAKITEWIKRYAPAEILSLITTFIFAGSTYSYTKNHVASAVAGTWGGNAGFFGYILTMDILQKRNGLLAKGLSYSSKDLWVNIRALIVEFGLAEIADSFFIRPFLMYYLPIFFGNFSIGILLAKIAADITFYIPAIFFYESNKNILKRKNRKDI
jgi:hypothetical protein